MRRVATAIAMLVVLPVGAMAQQGPTSTPASPPAAVSSGTDSGTAELNRRAADFAIDQNAANAAGAAQYQQSMAEYEAARTAAAAARAAYEAELEANRQARAAYDAARARWQADVAACTAGDYARCQQGPAPK